VCVCVCVCVFKVGLKRSLFDIDCDNCSCGLIACVGIQWLHSLKSFYILSHAVRTRFVMLSCCSVYDSLVGELIPYCSMHCKAT